MAETVKGKNRRNKKGKKEKKKAFHIKFVFLANPSTARRRPAIVIVQGENKEIGDEGRGKRLEGWVNRV